MYKYYMVLAVLCLLAPPVLAVDSDPITLYVPQAQRVGTGRLDYAIWPVYNATLYAPDGHYDPHQPFALELDYLRDITGQRIADASVQEMRRLNVGSEVQLAMWHEQMAAIFPNVTNGSQLIGIRTHKGATLFFDKNEQIGEVLDPSFTTAFFAVWFDAKTSAPALRAALLKTD